tara:strand:+ start:294 stop:1433 length:1140 start_codon:yes stop_codon:yes gene_type:complete
MSNEINIFTLFLIFKNNIIKIILFSLIISVFPIYIFYKDYSKNSYTITYDFYIDDNNRYDFQVIEETINKLMDENYIFHLINQLDYKFTSNDNFAVPKIKKYEVITPNSLEYIKINKSFFINTLNNFNNNSSNNEFFIDTDENKKYKNITYFKFHSDELFSEIEIKNSINSSKKFIDDLNKYTINEIKSLISKAVDKYSISKKNILNLISLSTKLSEDTYDLMIDNIKTNLKEQIKIAKKIQLEKPFYLQNNMPLQVLPSENNEYSYDTFYLGYIALEEILHNVSEKNLIGEGNIPQIYSNNFIENLLNENVFMNQILSYIDTTQLVSPNFDIYSLDKNYINLNGSSLQKLILISIMTFIGILLLTYIFFILIYLFKLK